MVQAQNKGLVDKASAEAAQAGPLAQAQAQQRVIEEQATLAAKQAELRERQLQVEVIKPAEAEAAKVAVLARADAEKITLLAQAAASSNRVNLDQLLIEKLPEVVGKIAQGIQGANLTVLNGADGLAEVATSLVSQGFVILEMLKKGMNSGQEKDAG